jgi:hypothetical protein
MRSVVIVIQSPRFDFLFRIFDRKELIDVQALIPKSTVKRFYVTVIRWPPGSRKVELDASLPGPFLERLRGEFRSMINGQRDRQRSIPETAIEGLRALLTGHRETDLNQGTLATQLIDYRQQPKRPAIEQLIMHKIHAPALMRG